MRIYLSGKITGKNMQQNIEKFTDTQARLEALGHDVINPARFGAVLPRLKHAEYVKIGEECLKICDKIFMLDNYRESKKATEELYLAHNIGKEIEYENPSQAIEFRGVYD